MVNAKRISESEDDELGGDRCILGNFGGNFYV